MNSTENMGKLTKQIKIRPENVYYLFPVYIMVKKNCQEKMNSLGRGKMKDKDKQRCRAVTRKVKKAYFF